MRRCVRRWRQVTISAPRQANCVAPRSRSRRRRAGCPSRPLIVVDYPRLPPLAFAPPIHSVIIARKFPPAD